MMPTVLLTRTGEPVTAIEVPPMEPPPEIVCWGSRFFVRNAAGEYREGFCYLASRTLR
jgi:hypothetical protein